VAEDLLISSRQQQQ